MPALADLALAIACQRQNIRATVLERADALSIVGVGIQLSPNATRVLGYLGVWDTLAKDVVFLKHRFVAWDTAEPLLVTPLGDTVAAAFGTHMRMPIGQISCGRCKMRWTSEPAWYWTPMSCQLGRQRNVPLR